MSVDGEGRALLGEPPSARGPHLESLTLGSNPTPSPSPIISSSSFISNSIPPQFHFEFQYACASSS